MNRSDAPKKQAVPFATNGQRENLLPTTPAGDNTASYDLGFPPVTMILKAAGGLPPKGQDMNQILFELSSLCRWMSAGALNAFDSSFSATIGGYPTGSVLVSDDATNIFINTIDANTSNPNSGGSGWLSMKSFLKVDRIDQDATETRLWSPDRKSYIFMQNGAWGAYSINAPVGTVALGISSGGTGDTSVSGAKFNLQVDRLVQGTTDTYISSPVGKYRLFVKDDGDFGVLTNSGDVSPLSLARGGTGSTTATGARSNLGLGNSSTLNVGTSSGTVASGNDSRIVNAVQRGEFTSGPGWVKFPDGTIIQRGTAISGPTGYPVTITLPIPFTSGFTVTTSFDSANIGAGDCPSFATTPTWLGGFNLMSSRTGSGTQAGANWIAIGK